MLGAMIRMCVVAAALQGCEGPPPRPFPWPENTLRIRQDPQRERIWLLTHDGVSIYSTRSRARIRELALPGWHWAGEPYSCAPDLAVGPAGEALVTSDVAPTLWRVDPAGLQVTRHELALDAEHDRDVGFTALAYSAERDAYFAVSFSGSLWRLGPALEQASRIALPEPLRGACGLHAGPLLCVRGELGINWTVDPEQGRVSPSPDCPARRERRVGPTAPLRRG